MVTPFVVVMCKYVFYFGVLPGDNSRGPETMIVLLGVRKCEEGTTSGAVGILIPYTSSATE